MRRSAALAVSGTRWHAAPFNPFEVKDWEKLVEPLVEKLADRQNTTSPLRKYADLAFLWPLHSELLRERYVSDPGGTTNRTNGFALRVQQTAGTSIPNYFLEPQSTAQDVQDIFAEYDAFAEAGWDGEDAVPITSETIVLARLLLKNSEVFGAPDAAPGADGSVGLEWWNGAGRLFVDIGPGKKIIVYTNLGNPVERPFQWGDEQLVPYLARQFALLFPERLGSDVAARLFGSSLGLVSEGSNTGTKPLTEIFGFVR
jgi:hypothetical protein